MRFPCVELSCDDKRHAFVPDASALLRRKILAQASRNLASKIHNYEMLIRLPAWAGAGLSPRLLEPLPPPPAVAVDRQKRGKLIWLKRRSA
ncbi:MAG: hypothetical protein WCB21_11755, partial [Azonexus sp.]